MRIALLLIPLMALYFLYASYSRVLVEYCYTSDNKVVFIGSPRDKKSISDFLPEGHTCSTRELPYEEYLTVMRLIKGGQFKYQIVTTPGTPLP